MCWQVSSGYLVVVFVYVTEFTGIKVRTWTSMHVHAAFAVGIMVVALVGYLVRVWWIYQIILTLSTSPFLLYCWKFPETPFFLMAKGRYKEAQELLDTMACFNGLPPTLKVDSHWQYMEFCSCHELYPFQNMLSYCDLRLWDTWSSILGLIKQL